MRLPGRVLSTGRIVERGRLWAGRLGSLRSAAYVAGSALALLPVISFFLRNPPGPLQVLVVGMLVLAGAWPAAAWLVLAGLAPFGRVLGRLANSPLSVTEQLVLAFLAGWLAREAFRSRSAAPDQQGFDRLALRLAGLFALAVVCSLAVQLVVFQVSTTFPLDFAQMVWRFLWHDYHAYPSPLPAIPGAAFVLEGVGLFAATVVLAARRPPLARRGAQVFAATAAVAAAVNVAAVAREALVGASTGPLTFAELITVRGSFVFPDVNAAGSYFVMALFVALGLAASARHRARLAWLLAAVLVVGGIWFSGSRTALVAAPLVGACLWVVLALRGHRLSARIVIPTLFGLAILASAYLLASPRSAAIYTQSALRWRTEMSATALRMARAYPVFGIGPGLFYELSYDFSTPEWLAVSPPRENAHNNFLQVLAELGTVGFIVLIALLAAVFGASFRQLASGADGWVLGLAAGGLAFVATWLTGHPLLVRQAALPFWLVLGLTAARVEIRPSQDTARRRQSWTLAAAILMVALVPAVAHYRLGHADLSREGRGFSQWHREADGTRFRWMFRQAVLYVPAAAREVSIGVRSPGGVATVRVTVEGRRVAQFLASETEWQQIRIEVPADYSWNSVPVMLTVLSFQPSAGRPGSEAGVESRVQVALPRVIR